MRPANCPEGKNWEMLNIVNISYSIDLKLRYYGSDFFKCIIDDLCKNF